MKKQFTKVFFALGTLIISTLGNTQVNPQNMREGENIEYCKQHVKLNELMQNPAYYEQYLKDQQTLKATELALKQSQTTRSTYYIPVVFHVLHVGGNENISDEQIHDAVAILNRDFRRLNADANTVHADFNASNPDRVAEPADIEVEFRLATIAPDGTCFSGITRTFSALTNESDGYDQVDAIKAGNDVYRGEWKGDQYLNIFVIRNADGAAGYTNYPSNWGGGNSMENGIWVLHNYVGSIGTSSGGTSRTLTHEVGHWLNLPHTWGSTNEPGLMSNCSTDDGVSDTPNTIGSQSCKLSENSCGPRANVENYMDYSYCSKMFTIGQGDRMRAALASTVGGRKNIVSASNLAAVGADGNLALCNVNFEASNNVICAGSKVQFTDKSFNNVQTRTWTFEGGTPATSTDKNPEITYNTAGIYKVELTVSDGTNSLSKTETNYIVVQDGALSLPFFEGFENYNSTNELTQYQILNADNNSKQWELNTNIAHSGSKSLYLQNHKQDGDIDAFISPTLDLSNASSATGGVTLSFRYAAAKRSSAQASETFKVFISGNCGTGYVLRKTLTSTSLTTTVSAQEWTPTEADWKTVHVTNITTSYFTSNFRFKFQYESTGGNNIYLDDINLYQGSPTDNLSVTNNDNSVSSFVVYPNPTADDINVSFYSSSVQNYEVRITDVTGKIIQQYVIQANEGTNDVLIDGNTLASGSYFISVSNGQSSKTKLFVKE